MSNRQLVIRTALLWVCAAISIDHLFGLQGLIARHHAGLLDPWMSVLIAVLCPLLALASTILWWRRHTVSGAE